MHQKVLARLKIERMHLAPRALELSPAPVVKRFPRIWTPLDALSERLRNLPTDLVLFWLQQPGGHMVITHSSSRYEAGECRLKRTALRNVAYVGLSDLAQGSLEALVPVAHLLDHLLGNGGAPEGHWLSEGGGVNAMLQEIGARIEDLFHLGHGFDAWACSGVRTYFARSLALYLHDRHTLNVADPLLERLLRTTLCADAFWRSLR